MPLPFSLFKMTSRKRLLFGRDLHEIHDVCDRDPRRGASQVITAVEAALGVDQAAALELVQNDLQKSDRDRLRVGNIRNLGGSLSPLFGQLKDGTQGILIFSGRNGRHAHYPTGSTAAVCQLNRSGSLPTLLVKKSAACQMIFFRQTIGDWRMNRSGTRIDRPLHARRPIEASPAIGRSPHRATTDIDISLTPKKLPGTTCPEVFWEG